MRVCLAGSFALLTILAVVLKLTSGLTWWAAAVCAALTAAVLVAGRRAVVVERRAERYRQAALNADDAVVAVPAPARVSAGRLNADDAVQAPTGRAKGVAGAARRSKEAFGQERGDGRGSEAAPAGHAPGDVPLGRAARRAGAQRKDQTADGSGPSSRPAATAVSVPSGLRPADSRRTSADDAGSERFGDTPSRESDWDRDAGGRAGTGATGSERLGAKGESTASSTDSAPTLAAADEAARARRPGISGRVRNGRAVYHLPESVRIRPVELEDSAQEAPAAAAKPRRLTPARPKAVPHDTRKAPARSPKPTRIAAPADIPAPTYTMMPGAPKWEPKALTALDYAQAREAAARATQRAAAESRAEGVETSATGEIKVPDRVVFADAALDLDRAIAARRRAAGR
jgi:hypothetical protein